MIGFFRDNDALVCDVFARDRHGLTRVALAVLEHIGERPPVDAAGRIDLVERDVEPLLPLCAVLGVLTGERTGDANENRFLLLCERANRGKQRERPENNLSAMQRDHCGTPI